MKTIFLTSRLDTYNKDEQGNRIPKHFGNKNGILDNLKKYIKEYNNFLWIASNETSYEENDVRSKVTFDSFNLTLPFKNYNILDGRNKDHALKLVKEADLIILTGGHGPTQKKFFDNINLATLLQDKQDGIILGISAGSMNSAKIVYCPPEEEGEAIDVNFKRFYEGLGLTNINIMPHRTYCYTTPVDNKDVFKEFFLPDSYTTDIISIEDGSYIIISDNIAKLYGEGYLIRNGSEKKICEEGEHVTLK